MTLRDARQLRDQTSAQLAKGINPRAAREQATLCHLAGF
ncbi:hypothetical protein [Sodalis sp. dw_96]